MTTLDKSLRDNYKVGNYMTTMGVVKNKNRNHMTTMGVRY